MDTRTLSFFALTLAACSDGSVTLYQAGWDSFTGIRPPSSSSPPMLPAIAPGASNDEKFSVMKEYFLGLLRATHTPGGALVVVLDGRLAFEAGLGTRATDGTDPVTPHTLFRIGSTNKLLTAMATMALVERGSLDLDRPLPDIAPWFTRRAGDDARGVTLRRALSHTAGIPEEVRVQCDTPPGARLQTYFMDRASDPLWAPPGAVWNYSNGGYTLAGAVLEQAANASYDQLMRDLVLTPAGMLDATTDAASARGREHALGHRGNGSALERSDEYDCAWLRPAGGLWASIDDFGHLLEVLLANGDDVLSPASVAAIEDSEALTQLRPGLGYGFGLFSTTFGGERVLFHGGNVPGYNAYIALVPSRRFGVAALVNADGNLANAAALSAQVFLGLAIDPPPSPQSTDPSSWTEYAGTYDDTASGLGSFQVNVQNGTLVARPLGDPAIPLPGYLTGTFWRGNTGAVEYFVSRSGVARRRMQ